MQFQYTYILTNERAMSPWIILGAAPRNHRHNRVMVQMQERYLAIFLAQHKEHGVQQLRHFRQEINVTASRLLQR